MKKIISLIILLTTLLSYSAEEMSPEVELAFDNIKPHPRLLMSDNDMLEIKSNISKNKSAEFVHNFIIAQADEMIDMSVSERTMTGKRLLGVSMQVLKRVWYLSYAYRFTGDEKYAKRAEKEMLAVAEFTDFNPSHFLDVAEMSTALSIGYDWLYNYLSDDSKKIISDAIEQKVLNNRKRATHIKAKNNWNTVCNAGMIYASIATYENNPKLNKDTILACIATNKPSFNHQYAPDGNHTEGSNYWQYATTYQLLLIESLVSSFGSDFGYYDMPPMKKTSLCIRSMIGSSGYSFNYSDAFTGELPFMMANAILAKKFDDKKSLIALKDEKDLGTRFDPMILIGASDVNLFGEGNPNDKTFFGRGSNPIALVRTSWDDEKALFLAIKGGTFVNPHAHMDSGSFVFDIGKTRWIYDVANCSYNDIEQLGINMWDMGKDSDRWKIARWSNEAHNVLIIDNKLPEKGKANIIENFDSKNKLGATVDLSATYLDQIKDTKRTAVILDEKFLKITDTFETLSAKNTNVRWNLATLAKVKIVDNNIELEQDGKTLLVQLECDYTFTAKIFEIKEKIKGDNIPNEYNFFGFDIDIPANSKVNLSVSFKEIK